MSKRAILILLAAVCLIVLTQTAFADNENASAIDVGIYADVSSESGNYEAIAALTEAGVIQGGGDACFNGSAPATNAMLWTMLARLSDENIADSELWYEAAGEWCSEAGIAENTSPDESLTAGTTLEMLFQYAAHYGAIASEANYVTIGYRPNFMTSTEWAEFIGIGAVDTDKTLTRNEAAELVYKFSQYMKNLTYEEFAAMLCSAYGVELGMPDCSNVCIAIDEGFFSIESLLQRGQTLADIFYLNVPTEFVLETISSLSGANIQDMTLEPTADTQFITDEYTQELITEYCTDTEGVKEHPDLNSFFTIESNANMYETYARFNAYMWSMLYNLDNIPPFIVLRFIDDGWNLIITNNPSKYAHSAVYAHAGSDITGLTTYDTKTIAIKSGYSTYVHEFGHYVTYVLTNHFSSGNEYTQALKKAYYKEADAFAAATDVHYGDDYKELAAEVFSIMLCKKQHEIKTAKETAPETYELIQYALDEANWN